MAAPFVKSFLPRSLFGRALVILIVPIVGLQLVVGFVFFQRHYQRVTDQMTRSVSLELLFAVREVETSPDLGRARDRLAALGPPLDLDLRLDPEGALAPGLSREFIDVSGETLARTLGTEIARPLAIDLARNPRMAAVAIPTAKGVLHAVVPRARLSVSNPHQLLVLMVFTSLILGAVAVLFLRNQVRPIGRLAEAAEAFGKGRLLPFRPTGAEEVRRAGAAFLHMRARLERQIEQRTQMLSGVSHDLRTPLTRMKLTLALMEETGEMRDLRHDADEMERMIAEFLAFARGQALEDNEAADPAALAAAVVENARRAGAEVKLIAEADPQAEAQMPMRAGAVSRALQNLVDNAARHGNRVVVAVRLRARSLEFTVEDDGPGIAPEDRTRALSPFARLDAARNQDRGGSVGLGLTVAMDVARSHGGTLELGQSPELGGLRAVLRLPR